MTNEELASKCHDIQISLGSKEVPEFEVLPKIGMMVNLSLHLRGLPILEYDKVKLASTHYFGIPSLLFNEIIRDLAEIEFVKLISEGSTIKKVIPNVPYFENVYQMIGGFATSSKNFNEPEQLALKILTKLTDSPTEKSNLFSFGAEKKLMQRNLQIGEQGGYIISKMARGKEIILSPLFFSENPEVFADLTARSGAKKVQNILQLIKKSQGLPLSIIEKNLQIAGQEITHEDLKLIKSLAQDGMVKPPSISTPHSGQNYFIFTPTPGNSKLNSSNKEIYERAMALIASVRQGQFLADKYRILWPIKILMALKRNGYLKPNTEAIQQYNQLALMRVGQLIPDTRGHRFVLTQTPENISALDLAINLLNTGEITNMEINEDVRIALQKDQSYIESIIASTKLREGEKIALDEETKAELDNLLIKGTS